jgi:sigma-B regulation protein RsbU (phosphoserine phosphatase)
VRRAWLWAFPLFLCVAVQVLAQQGHGAGPLLGALHRHLPAPPPAKNVPVESTPFADATNLGSALILEKGWRVGVTANPAAANPDFDDSSWAVRDAHGSIADVSPPEESADSPETDRRFAWFRMHLKLAPNHGPESLLMELPVSQSMTMTLGASGPGVDVFVNGKRVLPDGPHPDSTYRYQQITRIYPLGLASSETSVTLVVRTLYIPFGMAAYTNFFATRTFSIGNPEELLREKELWTVHSLFERLPRLVNAILLTVLSVFLLTLYFTQKGHPEYLWLALHELVQAPLGFIDLAGSSALLDQLWYGAIFLQLVMISAYLYFEFLVAFLALPRRWYIKLLRYTAPILAGVGPTLLFLGMSKVVVILCFGVFWGGSAIWLLGWMLFIFLTLIAATLRRNFEAGMLLIPLVLTIVGIIEPILAGGMGDFTAGTYHSPLTLQAGPIPIHFASIADFAGLLSIVVIIFLRFLRIHHEQERASGELAAARSVQELMIPREKVQTPGFEVDSVYNPATEVGGDFFHIEATADGGLLVIIGDVAGKGLQAAMNVSMLMGALRRMPDKNPARILESLNRVLLGSESFTTCQAAWFGPDGELVLANAGHLPPYLNTQEVKLPGGLPLGVVAEVTYDEVRLYLHPGDRMLLMSDGVVEARQPSGELFGFERVHNLSNQSAFYIADAAKAFGQEDDITVLTVRRLAEAMAA